MPQPSVSLSSPSLCLPTQSQCPSQLILHNRSGKLCYVEPLPRRPYVMGFSFFKEPTKSKKGDIDKVVGKRGLQSRQWRCIDSCCWSIGCFFTTWWLVLFVIHCMPPALTLPGDRLRREEGLSALHPVVLLPGIVTGSLELWEGKPCTEGLFRKRLWGGGFTEIFKRPLCWLEHLSLDNETGLDPPGIRVRAVPGLVAADYSSPGYFVWAVLIQNLARIGYEEKNLHMAAYDWRLSFQNTEVRDHALSTLKSQIELMYSTNGNKRVVVVPHSMGVLYFLHFLKWVEMPPPLGSGGGPTWCSKHIKAVMNIAPAFLGVPKAMTNIISNEGKDIAAIRAMAGGVLGSVILRLQTQEQFMRVSRTWDSVVSLIPKGGETIWGNLDWSPQEGFSCGLGKRRNLHSPMTIDSKNTTEGKVIFTEEEHPKYGRMIAFGKSAAHLPSSILAILNAKELSYGAALGKLNPSRQEAWTEHDEISRESTTVVVGNNKAYNSRTIFDLLRVLAPEMMKRGEAHFSHGIADNLDDPKYYSSYKYWSSPLETRLPDAPEMEIYCLYGVGIPTDQCKSIPFRVDGSAEGDSLGCLSGGVYLVDGDGSLPVVSSGFMCAKAWRGKTRFNPSGSPTYLREHRHRAPASTHVDIMRNVALIEDVLRVATGASGLELGGDQIFSDIKRISERIDLRL